MSLLIFSIDLPSSTSLISALILICFVLTIDSSCTSFYPCPRVEEYIVHFLIFLCFSQAPSILYDSLQAWVLLHSYMIFLEVCFLLHPDVLEKLYFHFFKALPTFSWDFFIESCILQKCAVQSSSVWYFPTLFLLLIFSLIPLCLWRKHRMTSTY